jgi:hypothetical protein
MKTVVRVLVGAAALLFASAIQTFAIEGLQLQPSLQSSNVILSWPSASGETYIVQFRTNLTDPSWLTLTSSLAADPTTNVAFFVHWDGVNFPYPGGTNSGGGTNDGGPMPPGGTNSSGGINFIPGTGFYQVVRDGVYFDNLTLFNLTNGFLSNNVNLAFEAGNAADDGTGTNVLGNIECAALLIDGTKFPGDGGVLGAPSGGGWQINMDSAYLENGTHSLQVAVTFINPDNSDGNNVNITRYSNPVTITVSNLISYPNWEPEIGEAGVSAYFLQTVFTNVPWSLSIYDVSNNLVQTFTNVTPDGTITAYWNMVDTNGVTRTNADLDPEFSAVATVYDAPTSKSTPKKKQRHHDWPNQGVWVVSYQDFFKFEYSDNNYMQGSINAYADTAAKYGGYYLYYPQPGQTNDIGQTYPLRYQKTNHPDTNITGTAIFLDQQLLREYLSNTNSRNFFYDGHGNPNSFADIDPALLKATIQHRYRFVMIDACSSANGDLDDDFGIHGPSKFAVTYYENTGIRPGAFCGYNEDVDYATGGPVTEGGVTYDDTIPDDVPFFIYNFLFYWDTDTEGYRLNDAIYNAAINLPDPYGFDYREEHWQIYGYDDMRIDEDNHGSDTW